MTEDIHKYHEICRHRENTRLGFIEAVYHCNEKCHQVHEQNYISCTILADMFFFLKISAMRQILLGI